MKTGKIVHFCISFALALLCLFLMPSIADAKGYEGTVLYQDNDATLQNNIDGSGQWEYQAGAWYYNQNGEKVTGWQMIDNVWYFFDGAGVMQTGWEYIGNKWYYLNTSGAMQTGWLQRNGVWYYLDNNGVMVTGSMVVEGKLCNFDSSGVWQGYISGWHQQGSDRYYAQTGGEVVTGWKSIDDTYYFFSASGVMQTGWVMDAGKWYYMDSNGAMKTGWVKDAEKWYYLNASGAMHTGWLNLGAAYYYINGSGVMQTGWLQQNGGWYYLDDSGVMAVGKVFIDEQPHKFTLDGIWQGETANAFSDKAMEMLKEEEGFSHVPYWDYSQWTVGYGTKCPDDMVAYYKAYGIPETDAQILLIKHMAMIEADVDAFVQKYGLTLTGHQYDALVLFSYNCGTSWCHETDGTFHNMIKNQATGNDLIRGFALWCSAGGEIRDFLVRRRMSEANMYLNGVYSLTPPEHYCFVTYDANGGATSPKSQGYDSDLTAEPYPVPTYAGYVFDGWYTAKTGGTKVTALDASHNNTTLYAHWAELTPAPSTQGPSTVTITVTNGPVNVRVGPGVDNEKLSIGTLGNEQKLTLTEFALGIIDKQTGEIGPWGKFEEFGGGWVCLKFTDYDTAKQQITAVRWTQKDKQYYCYLGIEIKSGWIWYNEAWYYTDSTGLMLTGWQYIGGKWYYFAQSGAMVTGWLQLNNAWYFMSESGAMVTGTIVANGKLCNFNTSGVWQGYVSGWSQQGSSWYYAENGKLATGWKIVKGIYYFFNASGEMQTGWLKSGNTWYYLKSSGAMATGWAQVSGAWYYFASSGAMTTEPVEIGGKIYNFSPSGACLNP